ncbi:pollen-specific leucine-rich repeat extensin-like protein 2 [Zingiber officinale]|uniref:pollen-specific leucine-rich repeat extensin-like protein 2 n=1 Tax=Zingiber officinale TaxID=94328 RepID=UPI001C4B6638|nr:pollen-specific leucine-rich repeat extensin-like protein 2 [Zingiber officinale]
MAFRSSLPLRVARPYPSSYLSCCLRENTRSPTSPLYDIARRSSLTEIFPVCFAEAAMFRAYSKGSARMPSDLLQAVGDEVAKGLTAPSATPSHETSREPSESSTPLLLPVAPPEAGPVALEPIEEERAPSPPPDKCLRLQRKRKRVAPSVQASPLHPPKRASSKPPKVQVPTPRVPAQESPRVAEVLAPTPVRALAPDQAGPSAGNQPGSSATPSSLPNAPYPSSSRTRGRPQRNERDFTTSWRLPSEAESDPVRGHTPASASFRVASRASWQARLARPAAPTSVRRPRPSSEESDSDGQRLAHRLCRRYVDPDLDDAGPSDEPVPPSRDAQETRAPVPGPGATTDSLSTRSQAPEQIPTSFRPTSSSRPINVPSGASGNPADPSATPPPSEPRPGLSYSAPQNPSELTTPSQQSPGSSYSHYYSTTPSESGLLRQ